MNRYIICTIVGLLFVCGCATIKNKNKVLRNSKYVSLNNAIQEKYEALNDYIDDELKYQSKEVSTIIVGKKLSIYMTLNILKTNNIWAIDSNGKLTKDYTFYKKEDLQKLMEENGISSQERIDNHYLWENECCWTADDFRDKNIIFENFIGEKKISSDYFSYCFSEPLYYKNKKYVIFTKEKNWIEGPGNLTRLIIMKKINNKWVQVYKAVPFWND